MAVFDRSRASRRTRALALGLLLVTLPASSQTLIGKFIKDPVRPAPGHYFVFFVQGTNEQDAEALANDLSAPNRGAIQIISPMGFRVAMSEEAAIALSQDPRVKYVADYPLDEGPVPSGKYLRAQTPRPGTFTVWLSNSPHLFNDARVRQTALALCGEYGGEVVNTRAASIGRPSFSLKATETIARTMAADDRVQHVDEVDDTPTQWVEPDPPRPLFGRAIYPYPLQVGPSYRHALWGVDAFKHILECADCP